MATTAQTPEAALAERGRQLALGSDIVVLAAMIVLTAAIALWAVDPTAVYAMGGQVDVPPSLLPALKAAGLRIFDFHTGGLASDWQPGLAESTLGVIVVVISAGAAMRQRWPLYFASHLLLAVVALAFSFYGVAPTPHYLLLPAGIAIVRALVAKQWRMAPIVAGFTWAVLTVCDLSPISVAAYRADGRAALEFSEVYRFQDVPGAPKVADIVASLPAGRDRDYVEAQIAYTERNWPLFSARMSALKGYDSKNITAHRRIAILRETAEFIDGGRHVQLWRTLLGYGLAAIAALLAGSALLLDWLGRVADRRIIRLDALTTRLRFLRGFDGAPA